MLCDLKVMQLGGIHGVQLADIFGTASSPNHNGASFAVDLGDRSGFEDEVAVGKDLRDLRHDSCGKGIFSLEFTFGFVSVLNGPGDGGQPLSLGVVRAELFVKQSAEVGPLVDPGIQIGSSLRGEFRRAFAATVFTDQNFNQIMFVEHSWLVLTWGMGHLQVAGVPRIQRSHCLRRLWLGGIRAHLHAGQRSWSDGWGRWHPDRGRSRARGQ